MTSKADQIVMKIFLEYAGSYETHRSLAFTLNLIKKKQKQTNKNLEDFAQRINMAAMLKIICKGTKTEKIEKEIR